jgi:hypothetical protein
MYAKVALKYDQSNNLTEVPLDKVGNDTSVFVAISIPITDFLELQNRENIEKKKEFIKSVVSNYGNTQNYPSALIYTPGSQTFGTPSVLWINVFDYIRFLTKRPITSDPENNFSALYTPINLTSSNGRTEHWIAFNNTAVTMNTAIVETHGATPLKEFDVFRLTHNSADKNTYLDASYEQIPIVAVSSINQDTVGKNLDLNTVTVFCIQRIRSAPTLSLFTPAFLGDTILIPKTTFKNFREPANNQDYDLPLTMSKTQNRIEYTNPDTTDTSGSAPANVNQYPASRVSYIVDPYDLTEKYIYSTGKGTNMPVQANGTFVTGALYGNGQSVFLNMAQSDGVEPNNVIKSAPVIYEDTPLDNVFSLSQGEYAFAVLSPINGLSYSDYIIGVKRFFASGICTTHEPPSETIAYVKADYSNSPIIQNDNQTQTVFGYIPYKLVRLTGTNENDVKAVVNNNIIVGTTFGFNILDDGYQKLLSTHTVYIMGYGYVYDVGYNQSIVSGGLPFIINLDNAYTMTYSNAIPNNSQPSVKNANGDYIALHARFVVPDNNMSAFTTIPGVIPTSDYYTNTPYSRGDRSSIGDLRFQHPDSIVLLLVKK